METLKKIFEGAENKKELFAPSYRIITYTALGGAIENGHSEVVKYLLENGADAKETSKCLSNNSSYGSDYSALEQAIGKNDTEIVSLLLDNGADANRYISLSTLLIKATEKNNIAMVQLLLTHGATETINKPSYNEETALYIAVEANNPELTKLLLDNGATTTYKYQEKEHNIFNELPDNQAMQIARQHLDSQKLGAFIKSPKDDEAKPKPSGSKQDRKKKKTCNISFR